jgi:hypothetical protein
MVTVMAVGITTICTAEEECGTITSLIVGAGAVDDELVGWILGPVVGWERKTG